MIEELEYGDGDDESDESGSEPDGEDNSDDQAEGDEDIEVNQDALIEDQDGDRDNPSELVEDSNQAALIKLMDEPDEPEESKLRSKRAFQCQVMMKRW